MNEREFIERCESGEIESEEQLVSGFQTLIDSGTVWNLSSNYRETALELIKNGYCCERIDLNFERLTFNFGLR